MATKFSGHWQLDPGLLIPQGSFSLATSWNTRWHLLDLISFCADWKLYARSSLLLCSFFLRYYSHNHVYMPPNTTFHFEESKVCSILQEFSTELSEEPGLTSEKSWRFEFSIRKNFSSNYRIVVNGISTSIRTLHNCVSLDPNLAMPMLLGTQCHTH